MDGHIPLLNDSRRAYAEITHVIFNIANIIAHSCFRPVYENIYQEIVNNTLPEALGQPQEVVETAKELFTALDDKTLKIQKLIIEITKAESNDVVADALINKIITNDPKEYKLEAEVLLAAGASAKKFNEMKDTFHDVPTSLESHKYIIRATQELKALILSLTSAIHLIKRTLLNAKNVTFHKSFFKENEIFEKIILCIY
ncbi:unnamed protein product [Arctia plantaginis]|uniref:Uncharacterized protein n=1 Tax=Arctia plantaginis TaxID=874455 RepID=A0A8S1BM23_ARCPL|nr:unnamed protein product [Arctia plantaginis]